MPHRYGIPQENFSPAVKNSELEEYKSKLREKRLSVGAIVMNCNPFTLGHQYLIEYAAARTDALYIFVVQEDKSFFKFQDRIELVRQGTAHIKNIKVIPSGKFIISSLTFSEYFDKANLDGTTVDTSQDVEIFAAQIAPELGINIRFVGEEPLDPVTRQYNQTMREILPKYGIEFCEIPRKSGSGDIISASRVRKAIKENDWDLIRQITPDTTYDFLKEHYQN